ncbi:ABC transporter ATP-binding protein [Paenibacillus sp. YYML68]|uniref:ABC transporter ATP-binding protein n=1 Tax=Paenibacillus sp. YYML68 TaxID=2909250 RepID=UPI002492A39E|nr:ABC transporter transmembrane domain-containing protein [Paenibacillus sp. YYML68]
MFAVLRKMSWYFKLEWRRYAIAIAMLFLVGWMEIVPPMLVGQSIDAIAIGSFSWEKIWHTLLLLAVITIVSYAGNYVWGRQIFGGSFVVERLLRRRFMGHLLKMTPTFYERNRTGDLMARATNDLQAIGTTAGFGMVTLLDSTLWMAMILATMTIMISWKLTLVSILPLPIMAVLVSLYGNWIHKRFMAAQDAFGDMNEGVLETVSGIRVIRAYKQERAAEQRFADVTQDVLDKNLAVVRVEALFEPTIKIMVGASYLLGLGYGAYLVYLNELTIGDLVAFNVYLGMLIWPMFAIGELINIMQRGNASIDRVNETLSYEPDVPEVPSVRDVPNVPNVPNVPDIVNPSRGAASSAVQSPQGRQGEHEAHVQQEVTVRKSAAAQPQLRPERIEFRHVTFRYPTSAVDNLIDVSFTVEAGQTLGLVGRTGSGKSTMLRQLLREYPPGDGSILISGIPLTAIDTDTLKSWYGYVPQTHFLFSRTIHRNLMFAHEEATEAELQEAVEASALRKDLDFLPEGLETLVGEKGVALSGGQKQRVAIARALLGNPQILMLDDSLSAVDARTEAEIIANLRRARQGKTTIIATHRLSAVQHADLILVLDEGRIIERGTHEQLMELGGWYCEQYIHQQAAASATQAEGGEQ